MTREQKLSAKLIYFSIAYGTNFSYLMIVLLMIFSNDLHSGSETRLLLTFLIPAAFTVFFSTIILRKSLENESDVTSTIVKLAIAHLLAIFGLMAFFIQVSI